VLPWYRPKGTVPADHGLEPRQSFSKTISQNKPFLSIS
jgi:hypothetical protein